jgi:hypothetical protein
VRKICAACDGVGSLYDDSQVVADIEWGVRWHHGRPLHPDRDGDQWLGVDGREDAQLRVDRYRKDEATEDDPIWGELIRREVVTVTGPTTVVSP